MTQEIRQVLHSSIRDDWGTPPWLFDKLHDQYDFTVDLCAQAHNALLKRYCDDVASGLLLDMSAGPHSPARAMPLDWEKERFFCNPPYGRQLPAMLDGIDEGACGIFLLPSRTGSRWWHDLMSRADWVFFLRGRLRFSGAEHAAPFDSALIGIGGLPAPQGLQGMCCCQS